LDMCTKLTGWSIARGDVLASKRGSVPRKWMRRSWSFLAQIQGLQDMVLALAQTEGPEMAKMSVQEKWQCKRNDFHSKVVFEHCHSEEHCARYCHYLLSYSLSSCPAKVSL